MDKGLTTAGQQFEIEELMNFKVAGMDEGQKARLVKQRYQASKTRARLKIRCPQELLK